MGWKEKSLRGLKGVGVAVLLCLIALSQQGVRVKKIPTIGRSPIRRSRG